MITKTKIWKLIREELKHKHLIDQAAEEFMKRIKDTPQNEDQEI